ncbi:hypothetical protein SERLA73DRAFT_135542 [Serpula lacrymans var. lacrymans S7.3]|uniref:Uncharacterized protein n=2 Tax=Serpula lacrymans var. lacrymans TaxID=341189 RepID=F8PU30_SERL3|nr:uncharacterized protein SERLADRAFT_387633 [Serpula lacrymans var. lacrymans S7.9]EGN99969.1 hypothetical protein SERLA73DRAFT_135542 [Serpula lacrymans var. lacrymans S7.3]EGO25534.1 hypothetical protein SERLADRAFT_387633 [Serpula lacrymans var. lacrymans S7.9]
MTVAILHGRSESRKQPEVLVGDIAALSILTRQTFSKWSAVICLDYTWSHASSLILSQNHVGKAAYKHSRRE